MQHLITIKLKNGHCVQLICEKDEIALKLLLPQKLKDQWVFKTENALQAIVFKEGI